MSKNMLSKQEKFSIRKFKVGASSVLISTLLFTNGAIFAEEQVETDVSTELVSQGQEVEQDESQVSTTDEKEEVVADESVTEDTDNQTESAAQDEELPSVDFEKLFSEPADEENSDEGYTVLAATASPAKKTYATFDELVEDYDLEKRTLAKNGDREGTYGANGEEVNGTWQTGIRRVIYTQQDFNDYLATTGDEWNDSLEFRNDEKITIPSGTYYIPSSTTWWLVPGYSGDIEVGDAIFAVYNERRNGQTDFEILVTGNQKGRTVSGGNFVGTFELAESNGTIQRNHNNTSTGTVGITALKASNITFDNMSFSNSNGFNGHTFDLMGVDNVTISNSTFAGALGGYTDAQLSSISGMTDHNYYSEGIQIDYATYGETHGEGGATAKKLLNDTKSNSYFYTSIKAKYFDESMIDGKASSNVTIVGNTFTTYNGKSGRGLAVDAKRPYEISGQAKTVLTSSSVDTVNSPRSLSVGSHSIYQEDYKNITITDNTFKNTTVVAAKESWMQIMFAPIHMHLSNGTNANKQELVDNKLKSLNWVIEGNSFEGITTQYFAFDSGYNTKMTGTEESVSTHGNAVGWYASVTGQTDKISTPFETVYERDDELEVGQTFVTEGKNGWVIYQTVDGKQTTTVVEQEGPTNKVIKVGTKPTTKTETVKYTTGADIPNPNLPKSERKLKDKGVDGSEEWTTTYELVDGKAVANEPVKTATLVPMIQEVYYIGTREDGQETVTEKFKTFYEADDALAHGQRYIKTKGQNGETIQYYQNGVHIESLDEVILEKIDEVIVVGTKPETKEDAIPVPKKPEVVWEETWDLGVEKEERPGKEGQMTTTTTYALNEETGEVTSTVDETVDQAAVPALIRKGTRKEEPVAFATIYQADDSLGLGVIKVKEGAEGKDGSDEVHYKEIESELKEYKRVPLTSAEDRVVLVGTKPTTEEIPFETVYTLDDTLKSGETKILVEGQVGSITTSYVVDTETGEVSVDEENLSRVEPITKVVAISPEDTLSVEIPYDTEYEDDAEYEPGYTEIVKEGVAGVKRYIIVDGEEIVLSLTEPENEVVKRGTGIHQHGLGEQEEEKPEAEVKVEIIPFTTRKVEDSTLPLGQEIVDQEGQDGSRTYVVTSDGEVDLEVTPALERVVRVGTKIEEPTKEETEDPTKEGIEEPTKEVTEEPTKEVTEEPAVEDKHVVVGGAAMSVGTQGSVVTQQLSTAPTYSRVARAKAEKSLPNTGEVTSVLGLLGAGISALGLAGIKRRNK